MPDKLVLPQHQFEDGADQGKERQYPHRPTQKTPAIAIDQSVLTD